MIELISNDYGVYKVDTNPTEDETNLFIKLIFNQIRKQCFKENIGKYANSMFSYGFRWGRKAGMIKPININSFAGKNNN